MVMPQESNKPFSNVFILSKRLHSVNIFSNNFYKTLDVLLHLLLYKTLHRIKEYAFLHYSSKIVALPPHRYMHDRPNVHEFCKLFVCVLADCRFRHADQQLNHLFLRFRLPFVFEFVIVQVDDLTSGFEILYCVNVQPRGYIFLSCLIEYFRQSFYHCSTSIGHLLRFDFVKTEIERFQAVVFRKQKCLGYALFLACCVLEISI